MFTLLDNTDNIDLTKETIKEVILERTSEILREKDNRFIDITITEDILTDDYYQPVIISASFSSLLDDLVLVFPTDYFEFYFETTYPILSSYGLGESDQIDNFIKMMINKIAEEGAELILLLLKDFQGVLNKNSKKYSKYELWIR